MSTTVTNQDLHQPAPTRTLVELTDVVKYFPAGRGKQVHSVDGVSLAVAQGRGARPGR